MATPDADSQILAALQQYQSDPANTIEALRPTADAGDVAAQALMAFFLGQQGRWPEALPFARDADAAGAIYIAQFVGQNLIGQSDPTLRAQGAELLSRSFVHPSAVDPYSSAQQLVQQGGQSEALQIVRAAIGPPPEPWRQRIEQAVQESKGLLESIRQSEAAAGAERERVVQQISSHVEASQAELDSVQRLGQEVGEIAHDRAADYLAKGYGAEADAITKRANLATIASITLAIGIAVAALLIATNLPAENAVARTLEKAAFSIPLLLLNAYIARLASQYREEALRWRHIKLQIQTPNPFLGALDEEKRKETLAVLATRFFPGQPMPLPDKAAEPSDVSAAIAALTGHPPPTPASAAGTTPPSAA